MIRLVASTLLLLPASGYDVNQPRRYDDIRASNLTKSNPIYDNHFYVGRNLHRVQAPSEQGWEDDVVLCHVPSFLRYSNAADYSIAYAASVGAMLAMHHFNTGDGSVVAELTGKNETCNIRLTTEIVDTQSSPIEAVRSMARILNRPPESLATPQPCAVFGAQISSVTAKLSSITGVFDVFQVSSSAMDTEFDNEIQYPLLARSHTDVSGFGEMSISYLKKNLGISNFGILVPQDSYGLAFQQSVLKTAANYEMGSVNSQYLPRFDSMDDFKKEIRRALSVFERERYNYYIAAFYPELLGTIMGIAGEMGLAGPGKFWMLSGTAGTAPYILSGRFMVEKDSYAAKAIAGTGIFFCKGGLPGVGSSYDRFSKEWKKIGENPDILDYMNSKQPILQGTSEPCGKTSSYFQKPPHHIVTFSYDAIVALGMSACDAAKKTTNEVFFTGKEHRDSFARNTFRGASGDFKLRQEFPTRTADSTYFVMVNLEANQVNQSHVSFQGSPVSQLWEAKKESWESYNGNIFVYADGTTKLPIEFKLEERDVWRELHGIVFIILICLIIITTLFIARKRCNQSDSIWKVKKEELHFDKPFPKIIGRGTFGLVILAEYRGTEVAAKRVIPSKDNALSSERSVSVDLEVGREIAPRQDGFINEDYFDDRGQLQNDVKRRGSIGAQSLRNASQVTNSSETRRNRSHHWLCKFFGTLGVQDHTTMRKEFIREMRILSQLRHPCIVTVMGAVLDGINEPILVMEYMQHGSLHDILHNMTMQLDGEIILPLLKDISQGVRFLHSATPKIIHGDLKAANVLVDSKFRAKVADFGLSQKKKMGASGTPYWTSNEILCGESGITTQSDVYSFGILLYEVLTRSDPYEGEDYIQVIEGIKDPKVNKRPPIPSTGPTQLHSLFVDCIGHKPESRPTFAEIDERLKRLGDESMSDGFIPIHSMQRKKDRTNRTNDLLFDVFPKTIAEALRDGKKVEPTTHDVVTIFFSDIVGFTTISSSLTPMKISDMLDRLYNKFDDLSHKHDVFKVETIGDAYMAVTNLVKDQPDHAKRIAEFAVEAMEAARETLIDEEDPSNGNVSVRIGFHSGPVVANVVGSRNPRYCLFGDTVNTASRMESYSEANRIHCSERFAMLIRDQYPEMPILRRGWIKVKGKDEMETYWVNEK